MLRRRATLLAISLLAAAAVPGAAVAAPRVVLLGATGGGAHTLAPGDFEDLRWAPDGTRVVGVRIPDDQDAGQTVVALAPGAPPQTLALLPAALGTVRLSPDATALAAVSFDPTGPNARDYLGPVVIQAVGGAVRASGFAKVPPDGAGTVAWSPDGRLVGAADLTAKGVELTIVDAATGAPVRSSVRGAGPATIDAGDWSPDGARIAFRTRGQATLKLFAVATGSVRALPDAPLSSWVWSPDGRALLGIRGRRIVTIDVASGAQRTLARLREEPVAVAWRPGRRQAAVLTRTRALLLSTTSGAVVRTLARLPAHTVPGVPAWSPDGSRVALQLLDF